MAVSKEELVCLYNDTDIKKNREIIFNKLYQSLEKEAMKICSFYSNFLRKYYKFDFFEESIQEASICLLKCIKAFKPEKDASFSTFYYTCLKNSIYNNYKVRFRNLANETVCTDMIDYNINSEDNEMEYEVDKTILYDILKKNIDNIKFTKDIHKNIFTDYVGFSDKEYSNETYASLARKYNLSRMATKKICDKYLEILKSNIKSNGDMDKIRTFL